MSVSSESKASYPASPAKQSSDTSSVPTDLTVSSNERNKVLHSEKSIADENKLLKIELRKKEALIDLLRKEYEEKIRIAENSAAEAINAKKVAEDNSKLRLELQNGEMGKIQAAITSQLEEVTTRQHHLEDINQKLREKAEVAKTKLESFQYDDARYDELLRQDPKNMSIFEFAELIIYQNLQPQISKAARLESYNIQLNTKLNSIENDINRLQNTIKAQGQDNEILNENLRIKNIEVEKIKDTVKSIDALNQSLEHKIEEYEKSLKHVESLLMKKERECELFRKRSEDLANEFKVYATENMSLNETLAALRHEFGNIRLKFDGLEMRSEKGLSTLSTFTKQMQEKQLELLEELSTSIFQNNLDTKYREQYLSTIRELVTEQIRSQEYMSRLSAERNKLQANLDDVSAQLSDIKIANSDANLRVQQEKERFTKTYRELEALKLDYHHKISELDVVNEKLAYVQKNNKIDVKKTKEYQTLLTDLKLLISHKDEIQDLRELIVKLQRE